MPFELRPFPNETLEPAGEYLQSTWKNYVYPTAERLGIKIVLPKVSPQPYTHLAFEGYQYAKKQGKGNEYNHRMFTAFFQDELDIGEIEILSSLASEVGLNEKDFRESLESREFKEVHKAALYHAYNEADIQVVPTFIIGETILKGIRTKEDLILTIEKEFHKEE